MAAPRGSVTVPVTPALTSWAYAAVAKINGIAAEQIEARQVTNDRRAIGSPSCALGRGLCIGSLVAIDYTAEPQFFIGLHMFHPSYRYLPHPQAHFQEPI